ncbi:MAG TPA: hypothetical protein VFI39_06670 [Gemmatimonadales bacterium]|nr:hypothetical protein [Gemmatimonadales bacterium]
MNAYQTKQEQVEAFRVSVGDTLEFEEGDWIIRYSDGSVTVMSDETFCGKFESADGGQIRSAAPKKGAKKAGRPKGSKTGVGKPVSAATTKTPRARNVPALKVEQMAHAKRQIEDGETIAATAKACGAPYGTVYAWAKANGWESKA